MFQKQDIHTLLASMSDVELPNGVDGCDQDELEREAVMKDLGMYDEPSLRRFSVSKALSAAYTAGGVPRFYKTLYVLGLVAELSQESFSNRFKATAVRHYGKRLGPSAKLYDKDPEKFTAVLREVGVTSFTLEKFLSKMHYPGDVVNTATLPRRRATEAQVRGDGFRDSFLLAAEGVCGPRWSESNPGGVVTSEMYLMDRHIGVGSKVIDIGIGGVVRKMVVKNKEKPAVDGPKVIIEAKTFMSTGSKQEDALGDMEKFIKSKRPDTFLLLATDGLAWHSRSGAMERLVAMQNDGHITRIYTLSMMKEFKKDLEWIADSFGLRYRGDVGSHR